MDSEESFLHGLSTYTPPCLRLTNSTMERIIRLLPTQADRYEACLIHRVWTIAAMNVLWEWPHFSNESAIRAFIKTIRTYKRLALAVRHLNLCLDVRLTCQHNNNNKSNNFSDNDESKAFEPIATGLVLYQHKVYKESPLASPQVIMAVLQQCERIDTLSIYGWKLEATHLPLIAAYLPQLRSLQIIGSLHKATGNSSNKSIILPPLAASSLTKLHLYTDYAVVPSRYMELQSLRVSLSHPDSLEKLVHGHQYPLQKVHELMLANTGVLKADHIKAIFRMFPNLTRLAMEDVKHPIAYPSIVQLESLKHLIIRSITNASNADDDTNKGSNISDKQLVRAGNHDINIYDHDNDYYDNDYYYDDDDVYPQSHMSTIFIENCRIQNNHLQRYLFNVDCLTRIKLHKCPSLTDDALTRMCTVEAISLEELEIVECIHIGNSTVRALAQSTVICTLRTFKMQYNGYLRFEDVFDFIIAASSHQICRVAIIGYPDITKSILGQYSIDTDVVLDQSKIRLLVRHAKTPKDRNLTSKQVIKLAEALYMDVHHLEKLIEHIQFEDNENNDCNNSANLSLNENGDNYIYKHESNNQSNNSHKDEATKANTKLAPISVRNYQDQDESTEEKLDTNNYKPLNHGIIESSITQKNAGYEEENDDDDHGKGDDNNDCNSNKNNDNQNVYIEPNDHSDASCNDKQKREQQLQVQQQEMQEREQQPQLRSQNRYRHQHSQSQQQRQLQQGYRKQEIQLPQDHEQQNHRLQRYKEKIKEKSKGEEEEEQERKMKMENEIRINDIRSNALYNSNHVASSSDSFSPDVGQENGCYSTSGNSSGGDGDVTNDDLGNGRRTAPDLGGWGMTSDLSWLQNNNDNQWSGKISSNSLHRPPVGYSYEHAWKQIAHESPIVTAKQTNNSKPVPGTDTGDGWGTPKANISWNDERLSYAHDVVEEHKNTTFWNQHKNGEWEELSISKTNPSSAVSYPPPSKSRSNHATNSTLRHSLQRKKSHGSDNLRLRPPSATMSTNRSARFGAGAGNGSPQAVPAFSTSVPRQQGNGCANKWAAFSASQMQQSEAKRQKHVTAQEEVKQLEIPDLINLDLKDDYAINQSIPAVSLPMYTPTTPTSSSNVEPRVSRSASLLVDIQ